MKDNKIHVDFDDYVDQYEALLKDQLSFFSKDRGYFSEYKVSITSEIVPIKPSRILDFGCGIGLSLPFLSSHFPNAQIFASDQSEKSVDHVRRNFPNIVVLSDRDLENYKFDLIFVTGVFHHIPSHCRSDVIVRLSHLIDADGWLSVFEHNPYNPVTRRMVATCPFDEDAELISLAKFKNLILDTAVFQMKYYGYCLYFPESLSRFRIIENYLRKIPLGGQYFIFCTKQIIDSEFKFK
jgi:trans-aconitate methyltransferase